VMPAAARRALTELGAESVEVGPDEVPRTGNS
jgi:hypothetical protein